MSVAAGSVPRVHASPLWPPLGDEEALAVWADELLEKGDGIGEFFQLQFKQQHERLSPRETARMHGLQRKHLRRLLGPLYRVLTNVHFRGGRPIGASLANNPRGLRRTEGHPVWQRLESLDFGPRQSLAVRRRPERMLDRCPNLKAVWNLDPVPSMRLPYRGLVEASVWNATVPECLATFPNLERLEVKLYNRLPQAIDPAHLQQLARLTFTVTDETQLTWEEGRWRLELGRAQSTTLEHAWFDFALAMDAEVISHFGLEPPSWDPPPRPSVRDDVLFRCGGVRGDDDPPF
jgi:hypothetical protein